MDGDAPALAPASLVRRLCAGLIDAPLSVVPFVLFLFLLNGGTLPPRWDAPGPMFLVFWAAVGAWTNERDVSVGVSMAILSLALSVWIYLFACRRLWDRPLGKRLASIRVLDTRGAELTFLRLYVREVAKAVIFVLVVLGIPFAAYLITALALAAILCGYGTSAFDGLCAVGTAYVSIGLAFPLTSIGGAFLLWLVPFRRKDKRALHDLLTGAMVVSDARAAKQERVDRVSADAPALAPAGARARLGATALDAATAVVPLVLLLQAVGIVAVLLAAVLWALALAASIGLAGQTLGKRAFRLRVIQAGGSVSSRNQIFLHELVKYVSIFGVLLSASMFLFERVPAWLSPFFLIAALADGVRDMYGDSLVYFALLGAFAVIPVSLLAIPVVFRKDKRALHDLLTDTMVVSDARPERPAP